MINFNKNSVFHLKPIEESEVRPDVKELFVDGEQIIESFKTVRDQLIFTNKRIIAIDVQGITGKRKSYSTLPYTTIQFFEVQTQGFAEIFPDSELFIQYANGFTAQFEFKGNVDIRKIGKMISNFVLN
ncbi:MAG: PH domain-containing protein [Treponema sp.]|nr:PH domain-containing protein [Treponema sp.]MBQ4235487.1 PH domain-containing protein [Treponema sp.]